MLILLATLSAWAQDQDYDIDIELFRPVSDTYGYLAVPSSATLGHLQLGMSGWVNYANDPLVLTYEGERVAPSTQEVSGDDGEGIIDDRLTTTLQIGMGLSQYFSFTAELPVMAWQEGYHLETIRYAAGPRPLFPNAVGDVRLTPKVVGLDLDRLPVGLAVLVPLSLPTGNGGDFYDEKSVAFTPMGVLELADGSVRQRDYIFRIAFMGGYHVRPSPGQVLDVEVGNGAVFGGGIGLHPAKPLEIVAEFHGEVWGSDVAQQAAEANGGIKYLYKNIVSVTAGVGTGSLPGFGAPDYRLIGGVSVSPSLDPAAHDTDADGVANDLDSCPKDAEDGDGFKDEDGCPDPDNDSDRLMDADDRCPLDPEDNDGFEDEDGCPEADNDRDKLLDIADRCPNEAENTNGYMDEDGCPDDAPIGDTDADGYKDDVDHCPYDPEDFDGSSDEDGCPDQDLVVIEKDFIKINDRIYFDTGKATIQGRSFELLDTIAKVVGDHPELKKIRIEGHTDSQGSDVTNLKLSQARADSVRAALMERGVTGARLDPVGFGEIRPIDTNETDAGRQNNRRVEFIIVDRAE